MYVCIYVHTQTHTHTRPFYEHQHDFFVKRPTGLAAYYRDVHGVEALLVRQVHARSCVYELKRKRAGGNIENPLQKRWMCVLRAGERGGGRDERGRGERVEEK